MAVFTSTTYIHSGLHVLLTGRGVGYSDRKSTKTEGKSASDS